MKDAYSNFNEFKKESIYNLVSLLLNKGNVITVSGETATGKTKFVIDLVKKKFSHEKIGVIDYKDEYEKRLNETSDIQIVLFNHNKIDANEIIENGLGLLIIEEAQLLDNLSIVKKINEAGLPLIVIKQVFTENDILEIGEHVAVSIVRTGEVKTIEHIASKSKYKRFHIYIGDNYFLQPKGIYIGDVGNCGEIKTVDILGNGLTGGQFREYRKGR